MNQEFTVGQTLYLPPERCSAGREVTIQKVGRKWLTLSGAGHRIDLENLRGETNGGYGTQYYLSKDIYDEYILLQKSWLALASFFKNTYARPNGISLETMKSIAELIKIDLEDVKP